MSRSFTQTGRRPLSPREREVLELLALGCHSRQAARELGLSPETVRTHIRNAMRKLGATTRVQAVALAVEGGLVSPSARDPRSDHPVNHD